MSNFKIEKEFPVPTTAPRAKYPFGEMEIGDSFYIETDSPAINCAASTYGKRNNKRFVTRREGSGKRVWRVE